MVYTQALVLRSYIVCSLYQHGLTPFPSPLSRSVRVSPLFALVHFALSLAAHTSHSDCSTPGLLVHNIILLLLYSLRLPCLCALPTSFNIPARQR